MHELSIAMSMIEMAANEAARHGANRVTALHLKLGALSGVVNDALQFSYEIACQGTCLEGSKLIVEEVPVIIHCATCGEDRVIESIQNLQCPACEAWSVDIRQGRELEVVALELEEAEEFVA